MILAYFHRLQNKINPMPGLTGTFVYDFLKNGSTWSGGIGTIYGLENKNTTSFLDVLDMVDPRDQQRFQDFSVGAVR